MDELGVQASSLLQANGVIWVEGPSDRIYIKRWIELLAPDLEEHRHYSFFWYGGKNISHFSVEDPMSDQTASDLIKALHVNRNSYVVCDRDRPNSTAPLKSAVDRVRSECVQSHAGFWLADGIEIENYLSDQVIREVLEASGRMGVQFKNKPFTQFHSSLDSACVNAGASALKYSAKKVEWARKFAEIYAKDDIRGTLKVQVESLITAIRRWNA
ncbi:hypothetical protein EON82_08540 [bacterium]|nr:MAG: hypothetical protein EON82_08540 [bacterium]